MELLNRLTSPKDIKDLNIKDLYRLCEDLRSFIVSHISKSGGHLASNLGVVEITVAVHNVFDTSRDRLIFDVGHQCYAHKILTGRKDAFGSIRAKDGISGFPNPNESIHDAYISGHASTSVSVALGMARARTALKEDYCVVAITGDGALTGGLAFEGLSDAGHSGEPLIIILNDNEMSITENVGGLSKHLAYLRVRPYYLSVKKIYRKTIAKIPLAGSFLTRFLRRIKSAIKDALRLPSSVFENMGFTYLGPTDGHNIKEVCRLLKVARELSKPVIIHLRTVKGKGYEYAEKNPELYHGVSPFDIENGISPEQGRDTFASVFGECITKLGIADSKICAITAAMQSGTGLDVFAGRLPAQFYDVGIAEGHAVTMAGGLSRQGLIPVCAIYSSFIQRAYDMIFHDVCLTGQHVVFAVDRAGLVPEDGPTHQGIYDTGFFLQMPGMTVLCPSGISEIEAMLRYAIYDVAGPVVIRYPKGGCDCNPISQAPFKPAVLRSGKDAAIVTYGRLTRQATDAAEILSKDGIDVTVIKLADISAADMSAILLLLSDLKITDIKGGVCKIFVVEECVAAGCLASKLALEASGGNYKAGTDKNIPVRIIPFNLGNAVPPPANLDELLEMHKLDAAGIAYGIAAGL